tara:strand:+ start:62 stop:496 length:435 start_codon:yes stop_codon:yes gene_type:complete
MSITTYINKTKKGHEMSKNEENKKKLATYHFEGCVQTLVGAFTTFNVKASKKEVEEYRRMVEAYTIDEMNNAVLPLGLKVKVRKNLNYMKLPLEAQKKVDEVDRAIGDDNCYQCSDGTLLEIGRYIKTPTSKKPSFVPFKKDKN